MLTFVMAAIAAISPISPVAHVDLIDANTVLVCYADGRMAAGPLTSFSPRGEPLPNYPLTLIEMVGGNQELVDSWPARDGSGRMIVVRTSCVTWTPEDCLAAHLKLLKLRMQADPPGPAVTPIK